jgi:protein TonB
MENTAPTARLNFTLIFSVLVHLIILLGVGFTVSSPPNNPPLTSLDITLVKQQTELAPDEADFLAQANNEGGGESDKKAPNPSDNVAKLDVESSEAAKAKPTPPPQPVITQAPTKPIEESTKLLTQAKAERKIQTTKKTTVTPKPIVEKTPIVRPQLTASQLIMQTRDEIKRLEQKLDRSTQALSKRPRKRPLSSRTKQYAAAAYHEAWRKKVERLGNMNYPQQAKRQRINGNLMLSVDINPDGSVPVDGIVVSRSSGHKILDDAAIKIVRLGAPYAPIPEDVLQDYDVITIIRTWKFETDFGLQAR